VTTPSTGASVGTATAEPTATSGPTDADTAPAGDATDGGRPEGARDDDHAGDGRRGGNAEAARYRTQLRAAEAERDTLRERLAVLDGRDVERIAGERMADGADLARYGVTVDQLLDDDGLVDDTKVAAAVDALLAERPHLAVRARPRPDRSQGARGDAGASGPTFADVLRGRFDASRL
jgi:hypothetical protein